MFVFPTQHAPQGVTKILVGNKCDMDSIRAVPTMRAVNVSIAFITYAGADLERAQGACTPAIFCRVRAHDFVDASGKKNAPNHGN